MADAQTSSTGYHLKKTLVMVGMMGAGKTAVGRALATKIGVKFLDSDAEIERAADRSVPEIFERDGEAFFRSRETEVISRLLVGTPGVLSTGGGAFLSAHNRRMISQEGVSLWLDADLDLLWSRVRHKETRPLLRTENPKATLQEIFEFRVPLYREADLSVTCDKALSIDGMAARVIALLLQNPDILEKKDA